MRLAIERIVGPRFATWGVAAAAVYAALVPACFLLGLIHGITRSNVAALAIATALPGAILGCRSASAAGGDFLRRIRQWHRLRDVPGRGDVGDSGDLAG